MYTQITGSADTLGALPRRDPLPFAPAVDVTAPLIITNELPAHRERRIALRHLVESLDHVVGAIGHSGTCERGFEPAAAERDAIFQAYYRSENTAALPGIGLGLAISHALVAQMGGHLSVESPPGTGSSFTIRLRACAEPQIPYLEE